MRTDVELPRVLIPSVAGDLGISDARTRAELRRGKCRTIARRAVLTRPEEPTRADWAALGIALGGPTAAMSGWDALRILDLGTEQPPTEEVLVLSRHASNRRQPLLPCARTRSRAGDRRGATPVVHCRPTAGRVVVRTAQRQPLAATWAGGRARWRPVGG
jgi:hypothetical protein